MTAEQWLADLEAKAKAYKSSSTYERLIAKDEYFAAANPATVLRLVGMVRWVAARDKKLIQRAYTIMGIHYDQP